MLSGEIILLGAAIGVAFGILGGGGSILTVPHCSSADWFITLSYVIASVQKRNELDRWDNPPP
jgi:uncharacterized membrane protein YfcA